MRGRLSSSGVCPQFCSSVLGKAAVGLESLTLRVASSPGSGQLSTGSLEPRSSVSVHPFLAPLIVGRGPREQLNYPCERSPKCQPLFLGEKVEVLVPLYQGLLKGGKRVLTFPRRYEALGRGEREEEAPGGQALPSSLPIP